MKSDINNDYIKAKKLLNLFDRTNIQEIALSSGSHYVILFLISAVFSSIITYLSDNLTNFFTQIYASTLAELSNNMQNQIIETSIPYAIALIPINFLTEIITEYLAYQIMKLSGGKGQFSQQAYFGSLTSISKILSMLLMFAFPFFCINIVAIVIFVILILYILLFVRPKGYAKIHELSTAHVLVSYLVVAIPMYLINLVAISFLRDSFGLDNPFRENLKLW